MDLQSLLSLDPTTLEGIQRFNQTMFRTETGQPGTMHAGQLVFSKRATRPVNLLSPGNSWGKTQHIAMDALMRAWFKLDLDHRTTRWWGNDTDAWLRTDWRGLIASFQYDIGKESFWRIAQWVDRGDPVKHIIREVKKTDPPRIVLVNGAVLDWGSLDEGGKHVEAVRRRMVKVDEVGHMRDYRTIHNNVLMPRTLGVAGKMDLYGTPKTYTDEWVFEIFEEGLTGESPRYFSMEGSSLDNPFWPDADRSRVLADPELVRPDGNYTPLGEQVILGRFIQAGAKFFHRGAVSLMFQGDHTWYDLTRYDEGRQRRMPTAPGYSFQAWDLAGSRPGGDATVGITVNATSAPYQVTHLEYLLPEDASWREKYDIIEENWRAQAPVAVGVDATGPTTDSVVEELQRRGLPVIPYHFGGTSQKKYNLVRGLQQDIEKIRRVPMWLPGTSRSGERVPELDGAGKQRLTEVRGMYRFPDARMHPELFERRQEFYRYRYPDDKKLKQDTVMAMAILADLIRQYQPPEAAMAGMMESFHV